MKSDNYILETVVCSSRSGTDARLHRMLSTRQLLRRRIDGCLHAWVSRSSANRRCPASLWKLPLTADEIVATQASTMETAARNA